MQRPDPGICVLDAALAVHLESRPSLVGQFQPVRFRDDFPIHPDTGVGAVGYETHQAPLAITAGQVAGTDYTVNAAGRVGRAGNTIDLDFITAAGPRTPIQSSPVRMRSGSKVRLELERAEILMNETTDEHGSRQICTTKAENPSQPGRIFGQMTNDKWQFVRTCDLYHWSFVIFFSALSASLRSSELPGFSEAPFQKLLRGRVP